VTPAVRPLLRLLFIGGRWRSAGRIQPMGAAAVASLLGGALLPWLGPQAAMVVPLAGALAVAYPLLKRLPLGKTVVVPLVWTWCGIVLPSGEGPWSGWRWIQEPVALPLFLLRRWLRAL
jgi:4-hydroxybenzoate polyprenyltransferase